MNCYNSTNTIYDNRIIDSYDYTSYYYRPIVEITGVNNDTYYEKNIIWNRNKTDNIPRKIYCEVYNACATETLTFDMFIWLR